MYQPKILILDIENTPGKGFFFGKTYETNILSVTEQSYILCFAYSWYPDVHVKVLALCDYKGYKRGNDCEKKLMDDIWKLLDSADIIVGQNSDSFDLRHINTRFAYYGMTPPSPYKTVDTLKKLRQTFNLPSNKLDFVCNYFEIGGKLPNTGKDLWLGCMAGRLDDWKMMKKYNAHDVVLTQKLYKLLLPWGKQPNLNLFTGRYACPACGGKHLNGRGLEKSTGGTIFQRLYCVDCGKWSRTALEKQPAIAVRPL